MSARLVSRIGAALALLALDAPGAWATWPLNGVPLCSAAGDQSSVAAASDSSGGAIVVWCDTRSGNPDIYAQRVDGSGNLLWAGAGNAVCTAANSQSSPQVVADGSHGAFVVWADARAGGSKLYAVRLTSAGARAAGWPANGLCVDTLAYYPSYPAIASDGAGGVVVVWTDYRIDGYGDVYAQRIGPGGARQWGSTGIAVCNASGEQSWPVCVPTGTGGAIVAWEDARSSIYDVYLQQLDASGSPVWTANGVPANLTVGLRDAELPDLAADGAGGAIVVWQDLRNGSDYDVYALRFTASGSAAGTGSWITGGVPICTASGNQKSPLAVPDGAGGADLQWSDYRNGASADLFAQRVTGSGDVFAGWAANGAAVCAAAGDQTQTSLLSDGAGGLLSLWCDFRYGYHTKIYAQRVAGTGSLASGWPVNGAPVCTSDSVQQQPGMAPDGSGGAIVAWQDNRSGTTYKVYATRVLSSGGALDAPSAGAPASFRLAAPRPNPSIGPATIDFELPSGRTVDARVLDVSGRIVRTLERGYRPAGVHALGWDGRDDRGNPVAAGVYLVRLDAGGEARTQRVVRLR